MSPKRVSAEDLKRQRLITFGHALAATIAAQDMTQTEIAVELFGDARKQNTISNWVTGRNTPEGGPDAVFALERVLGVLPGSLSRHLGYVPVEVVKLHADPEAAIESEPRLSAGQKNLLIGAFREFVAGSETKASRRGTRGGR